jgi:hypothetical protein
MNAYGVTEEKSVIRSRRVNVNMANTDAQERGR